MKSWNIAALAVWLMAVPGRLQGQSTGSPKLDQRVLSADTVRHPALFTRTDALLGVGVIAGTVLVSQADRSVAEHFQDTVPPRSAFVRNSAKALNAVGIPGSVVVPGVMYLAGLAARNRGLADAGLHTGEAVVLAEVATEILKLSFGRERPYVSSDPNQFKFGRGFKGEGYTSFPSGHAAGAFAAATAVTAEVSSRSPRATIFVAPLAFGTATLVGWARLETNNHWLSDVFLAAGMGTFIGLKTVRYNHQHPHNIFDRVFLPRLPAVAPAKGGLRLMWTLRPAFLESPLLP